MNYLSIHKSKQLPKWEPAQPSEDITGLDDTNEELKKFKGKAWDRKNYFAHEEHRKGLKFGPKVSFCNDRAHGS